MNYISEGIYIGSVDDAYQTDKLKEAGITHILTVDTKPLTREATNGVSLSLVHYSTISECVINV